MKKATKINLHINLNRQKLEWADYRADFEKIDAMSFEDFKDYLLENKYGKMDIKYIDHLTHKPIVIEQNMDVEMFSRIDFSWLIAQQWGVSKYIEITAFDLRMMAA
jgi:hypothetical protein